MQKYYGNVVLITGASSGIGKCIATFLCEKGYRVYGTSRKQPLEESADLNPLESSEFIKMIQLDVCCDESVEKAINYVVEQEGRIDILINNAGFAISGSVEDISHEEAYGQFDTNFFGVMRVCRKVIPLMRKNNKGLIINISSVAAVIAIPFQSMYSASKGALELMTEAMRIEVKPFGINVSIVEPGDTRTNFTENRKTGEAALHNPAYKDRFEKSVNSMIKDEMKGPSPEGIAEVVFSLIERENPPIKKVVGFQYKIFAILKRILPSRITEYIVSKLY